MRERKGEREKGRGRSRERPRNWFDKERIKCMHDQSIKGMPNQYVERLHHISSYQ